ncbi:MAG: hypothetical protein ACREMY_06535 [bacterium]
MEKIMTTKKSEKTEEHEDADEGDEPTGKTDGGGTASGESLDGRIRDLVREAVDNLLGDRSKSSGGRTSGDDEEALFQRVKKAQEKIKAEEDKDTRFKTVEETVETLKKVVEKAPARDGFSGKISRFLWGSE